MKNIFFAATIFSAALFASCRKDAQSPNSNTFSVNDLFVGANFQGMNWVGHVTTSFNAANDTLTVKGLYGSQYLVFKVQFAGTGTYSLTSGTQASYYTAGPNSTISSFYKLDTTQTTNTVTITSYDPTVDIARGDFQLSFVKTSGDASAPPMADFSNGKLWIQVPVKF
jgi:hypothetical protein